MNKKEQCTMNNMKKDVRSKYSTYGNGEAIIEILNIGFEPLLTNDEFRVYKDIKDIKNKIRGLTNSIALIESKIMEFDYYSDNTDSTYYNWLIARLEEQKIRLNISKKSHKDINIKFHTEFEKNKKTIRNVHDNRDFTSSEQFRNIVIFESELTRSFGAKDMEHNADIISVVTYYTEIFESIIKNGFSYQDKHYVFFTAGAGQTRCKKSTFVSEDKLHQNFNRLFCGLSREDINRQGGMNTNKYLAYTSLCQTNSEIWHEFNINKAIVVEDIEFKIPNQSIRHIYTESPEDKVNVSKLQELLHSNTLELKAITEKKKLYPKGYRRPKAEVAHEKELKDERIELIDNIDRVKSKYHKSSMQNMDVMIPFTDGFGISLKKMESSMIRLPFIKGLISYCPKRVFQNWCSENGYSIKRIVDIYGKSHSIADIDYIFTKSQFKMWNYYKNITHKNGEFKTGWEIYKENFNKFKCSACRCNVEHGVRLNGKTNYQVLQTLTTEMSNKDLYDLAKYNITNLNGIGRDIKSMLNVLGANEQKNGNLNWLQKSLILYPEMLKDLYVKTLLKNTKESITKKIRSGKFDINGAYTFAIPDPLGCLQWWFTDMNKSNLEQFGFVKEGSVSCNLFNDGEEIDCLRSPHLDHAHCIRINKNNESTKKWVKSGGVYIGMKDTMSKLLMYDNDGDKLLVHNNKTIIKCAKAFQNKYGIIPNYYDMPKANPTLITNDTLFEGLVMAYHHGNIGTPSNEITKVWATLHPESTKEEIMVAMDVIALRCADVNFTIDFAKTLYRPEVPKNIICKYKIYSGKKLPHFFVFAKNKKEPQVEKIGKCNIDRISRIVKTNRISFKNLLGKYSYKVLMNNPNIAVEENMVNRVTQLYRDVNAANLRKLSHIDVSNLDIADKNKVSLQLEFDSNKQRSMFVNIIGLHISDIVDILVKELKNDMNKDTLWRLFGQEIYNNINKNIKDTKICERCNERFLYSYISGKPKVLCEGCTKHAELSRFKRYYLSKKE